MFPHKIINFNINKKFLDKPNLAGYKCDCSNLNAKLSAQNGNEYVLYTGQNCTTELNSCQTLSHLCMHNSTCISSINKLTTRPEVKCQCPPGFTGDFCQFITSIRFDGTYALKSEWSNTKLILNEDISLKFDFRDKFFIRNEYQLPLIYFKDANNQLMFEINVHRHYLSIHNHKLGLNEHLAFYYPPNPDQIWHSIEIKLIKSIAHIVYSVKQLHLTETKEIKVESNKSLNDFRLGQFYWQSGQYLNGACVRDVTVNGEYIFKINPFISLNPRVIQPVKYGCAKLENQCLSATSSNGKCINEATCVHRWYDYKCSSCRLPYYGKNCHLGK